MERERDRKGNRIVLHGKAARIRQGGSADSRRRQRRNHQSSHFSESGIPWPIADLVAHRALSEAGELIMSIENRYGRKGGRGIRPWLLIPKIIAVIVYVGGLASDFTSLDLADPRRQLVLHQVSRLMVFLVVPALLLALVMGFALLMQFP